MTDPVVNKLADVDKMDLRRKQFSRPEPVEEISFNLGIVPLIFAVMSELGVKEALDSRLFKRSYNHHVQHSEIIMMLIARYIALGFKQGLHAIPNFAEDLPLNALYKRSDIELVDICKSPLGNSIRRFP